MTDPSIVVILLFFEYGLNSWSLTLDIFKIHNHRSALLTFSFFPQIATVEFLKEIKLTDPFRDVRLLSRDRLKPFPLDEECESQQMSETERYCEIAFWLHF